MRTGSFACAIAVSLLVPSSAISAPADDKPAKKRATFTVRKPIWKGYGFLPGYPKTERERRQQRLERLRSEPRFYTYYGGRYLGGGVTADSDPYAEYEETLHKAAGLLRALGRT